MPPHSAACHAAAQDRRVLTPLEWPPIKMTLPMSMRLVAHVAIAASRAGYCLCWLVAENGHTSSPRAFVTARFFHLHDRHFFEALGLLSRPAGADAYIDTPGISPRANVFRHMKRRSTMAARHDKSMHAGRPGHR